MRKIICHKAYDTDTAALVGEWDNGLPVNDFARCNESLYRKKTGEFFLHVAGGPASRAAVSCGNNTWKAGELIEPLTWSAAIDWAEEHMDAEDFESAFGEVSEGGDSTLSILISTAAKTKLEREMSKRGLSQRAIIEELIESM